MRDQRKGIQSVEHGAKLLEALVNSRKAQPLKTLAAMAGMSASMAHRYLTSFIRTGLVEQDPVSTHYDLGALALRLGLAALSRTDCMQVADDEFRQLIERVDIDGHISVWGTYGVTTVRYQNRHAPILSNFRLGDVLPLLDSAAGRIFLTYLERAHDTPDLEGRSIEVGRTKAVSAGNRRGHAIRAQRGLCLDRRPALPQHPRDRRADLRFAGGTAGDDFAGE